MINFFHHSSDQPNPLLATRSFQVRTYASKRKKMPPKKEVKQEKIPLGRPGNNLKSGIVRRRNIDEFLGCV